MPTITSLGFQKTQRRVNVFLDNKFGFSLATAVVLKHSLKPGQNLSQEQIESLVVKSWHEELYNQSLGYLSLRPHSQKETRDYLKRRLKKLSLKQRGSLLLIEDFLSRISQTLIEEIIGRLSQHGFLDDKEFAKWFIDQRLRFRPKGKRILELELGQKGISREVATELLNDETVYPLSQERELILQVAQKAWRQLQGQLRGKVGAQTLLKRRLFQRLLSRGFPFEAVKTVVDDLLSRE